MKEYIGRYEVQGELGQGGMGSVHLAYDPMLDRQVAIKVMSPALASDQTFVQRFLLEARAVARMEHPNIVAVYDADVADGHYYLVMEYVGGGSLDALIRQHGALPLAQVAEIIEQVASGLDYAHSHQMVHRDIKPNNILFDNNGQAHVTDFGLVKTEEVALTRVGQIFGTPAYMAPEQIEGQPVGPSTDVYALGVVAYQMLSGRLPFDGSMATIFDGHVRRSPLPLRQLNANIPPTVQAAVLQALGKQYNRRFKSTGAFAKALRYAVDASSKANQATEIDSQPNIRKSVPSLQKQARHDTETVRESNPRPSTPHHDAETVRESNPRPSTPHHYAPTIPESANQTPSPPSAKETTHSASATQQPLKQGTESAKRANTPSKNNTSSSKWGKRLLIVAGSFFLTICLCIMLVLVLANVSQEQQRSPRRSTNEPIVTSIPAPTVDSTLTHPNQAPEPLPTLPAENAPPVNLDFRTIVDDTGRLEIQVPIEWEVVDSGEWRFNEEPVGRYLIGTTNLEQVLNGWQAPGIFVAVSRQLVDQYTVEQLLNSYSFANECSLVEQADYDDGTHTGRYDLWNSCGSVDAAMMTIIATPSDQSYIMMIQVQMITEQDAAALTQIVNSIVIR